MIRRIFSLGIVIALSIGFIIISLHDFAHSDDSAGDLGGPSFPNDAGSAQVDVSKYPSEIQTNYHLFTRRCSQCHTLARPLNSQFLEISAQEQENEKTKEPDLFKDDKIWHIEEHIWNRYVHKMMAKLGSNISTEEGKKIWQFLVYDSKIRKMGANSETWRVQRQRLLDDFRKNNPKRYEELFQK